MTSTIFIVTIFMMIVISKTNNVTNTSVQSEDVEFLIFTREEPFSGYLIYQKNSESLQNSRFDPLLSTKFIIHGFQSSCKNDIFILIKNAFLRDDFMNIICVDWSYLAKQTYAEAIINTWFVGVFLSQFIQWLVNETGLNFENIHLIGHSLGSHVAGVAGSETKLGTIEKITGLDPAVPFVTFDPKLTLDTNDAKIVEIYFTSMLSYGHPFGNINLIFYGGIEQPDCRKCSLLDREYFVDGSVYCSHSRAYQIFAAAIANPDIFLISHCKNLYKYSEINCTKRSHSILELNDGIYDVKLKKDFC